MEGTLDTYTVVMLMYLGGTAVTMYKLMHSWRDFWADTPKADVRQLAVWTALFILVPIAILIGGLIESGMAIGLGYEVYGFEYNLYTVDVDRSFASPTDEWSITLVGKGFSLWLGATCLLVGALAHQLRRPVRLVLADFGQVELAWLLIMYPLAELASGVGNDWAKIYSFDEPLASGTILAVHLIALACYFLFLSRNQGLRKLHLSDQDSHEEREPSKLR